MSKGIEQGKQEGQASMVMGLVKHKFGEIDFDVEAKIQKLSSPQLEDLSEALLDFEKVSELITWLSSKIAYKDEKS
ncbi:MAG: DUF4351 domain-containing protein [Xenococcaceae cyanobacterium MO_207.B15]|nr:DUF4351 domain-containing protein [Xenococcaceae cyanobacterium MO_207.B15]